MKTKHRLLCRSFTEKWRIEKKKSKNLRKSERNSWKLEGFPKEKKSPQILYMQKLDKGCSDLWDCLLPWVIKSHSNRRHTKLRGCPLDQTCVARVQCIQSGVTEDSPTPQPPPPPLLQIQLVLCWLLTLTPSKLLVMAGVAISGLAGVPRAVKYSKLSAFSQLLASIWIVPRVPGYRMLCGLVPGKGEGFSLEAILPYTTL